MTIRVGVIGLGYFSSFHCASWCALDGVHLVAACDPQPERRQRARDIYGIEVFADAEAMLQAVDVDLLDIVAPPQSHDEVLRLAAGRVETLVCQKPFSTSSDQARALTDHVAGAGSRLIIHENFRFQPWHRATRDALHSNLLGEVYQAHFALRPGDGRGPDAYLDRQPAFQTMPRLLLHETGVHFADLFRFFFGAVRSVYADLRKLNPALAGEDAGLMMLEHANGVRSVFDGNRLSDHVTDNPRRTMGEMIIEGSKGCLTLDGRGQLAFRPFGSRETTPLPLPLPVDKDAFGGGCVHHLNAHVIRAINGDCPFENLAADYLHVWDIVDAAYRSHETGCKIIIDASQRPQPCH